MNKRKFLIFMSMMIVAAALIWGVEQAQAAAVFNPAVDLTKPNFAYSPTTIKKFVDSLPGLTAPGANNLGQYIPLAAADKTTFPGCDYYEIALVQYREQLHTNLPPVVGVWPAAQTGGTKLRGYVQEVNGVASTVPHYLGPLILATKNRPVRIKFTNKLPAGAGGNLFIPVDGTIMGAGKGPKFSNGTDCDPETQACAEYTQNRATIHLHGGLPPWISDGTAHQWITPATEVTPFVKGASQHNVPDMWYSSVTGNVIASCAGQLTCAVANATTAPNGVATFYWPNQQSGRLMFYHDHALGITGVNVYAGEAAGYLLTGPTEESALLTAGVPGTIVTNPANGNIVSADLTHLIPLVIQDKTFVSANLALAKTNVLNTDPLWQDNAAWGGAGDLWFPHVYMPNQDPNVLSGANPMGRWDWGPWFWPVFPITAPTPNPPTVSHVPEAFMDTPVVNGTAYPHFNVDPAPYRLHILNACNDRMLNLQLYVADPAGHAIDASGADVAPGTGFGTEVKMVAATPTTVCTTPTSTTPVGCFPATWAAGTPGMIPDILDSRPSGIPDPALRGPAMIQIGTEGGVLPEPVVLLNSPVGFEQNKRNIVVLNVLEKTLFMSPAERADVIVDFTKFGGKTIILYNDSPAPVPASDPRYDFYTGNPDMSATAGANNQGGPPSTVTGFGPNTRTIMQFRVNPGGPGGAPIDDYNTTILTNLQNVTTGLPAIFKASQDAPIVPESAYNALAYTGGSASDTFARIQDLSLTFTPYGSTTPITMAMKNKAIQELFDPQGRMNATLGVELPFTGALIQTTVPLGFIDPTTETLGAGETQLWKITHNGVDTHGIHFHLVNVQVVNRVGWDGAIRTTDPNELGWKDTVRMNPLEDIIVAMRAKVPTYPFSVPDSIRPLNPAMPVGSTFASLDPLTGAPITVTNAMTNFGHEYTWHCHILGHEENDMMRPMVLNFSSLLYVDIAATGLWQWNGSTFSFLTASHPASMVVAGSLLYADFAGDGFYKFDGITWTLLTRSHPASMVSGGSLPDVYVDFAGDGFYKYDGSAFTLLTRSHPQRMVAAGSILYADFAGDGLYRYDGTAWTRLTTGHPQRMATSTSGVVLFADFAADGLYKWSDDSGWTRLTNSNSASMVASGSTLYADFAAYGLYFWNGTAWTRLTNSHPAIMVYSGSTLYAYFAADGLYSWNGTAWTQLTNVQTQNMVASGSIMYADFGVAYGLYKWDIGAWSQITAADPASMVVAGSGI